MVTECNGCGLVAETTAADWVAASGGAYQLQTNLCYNIFNEVPANPNAPTFVNSSISTNSLLLNDSIPYAFITVNFFVVSNGPIFANARAGLTLLLSTPQDITNISLVFSLVDATNNIYKGVGVISMNNMWPSGTYKVNPLELFNKNGKISLDPGLTFLLTSTRSAIPTPWCPQFAGSGSSAVGTDGLATVTAASFCSSVILVGTGSVSIVTFTPNNTLTVSTLYLRIGCIDSQTSSVIKLIDGAQLILDETLIPASCANALSYDLSVIGTGTTAFEIRSKLVTLQNLLLDVPIKLNGGLLTTWGIATLKGIFNFNLGTVTANGPFLLYNTFTITALAAFAGSGLLTTYGSGSIFNGATFTGLPMWVKGSKGSSRANLLAVGSSVLTCSKAHANITVEGTLKIATCTQNECGGACPLCNTYNSLLINYPMCLGVAAQVTIGNTLTVKSGGILDFSNVGGPSFGILFVAGTTIFETGSSIVLHLSANIQGSSASSIPVFTTMSPCTDGSFAATLTLDPNLGSTRSYDLRCTALSTTGPYLFTLELGPLQTGQAVQANAYPYQSSKTYSVQLLQNCLTFGINEFLNAITSVTITGYGMIARDRVAGSSQCASVVVNFLCYSQSSVTDADGLCSNILSDATTSGRPLWNLLRGTSGTVSSTSSGSNSALFGLFALTAIPLLCLVLVILFLLNRTRRADNQYMQDTATFSNVAATPQPLGQPPYYGPAEVHAYPAPPPYGYKAY